MVSRGSGETIPRRINDKDNKAKITKLVLDKIRVLLYDIGVFLNKIPGLFNPISTERRKRCDYSNSS